MTHHPDCLAQNANTLFGGDGPCICPKGWPKNPKATRVPNPCHGATLVPATVPDTHYQVRELFTPSTTQLAAYAAHQKHRVPTKHVANEDGGESRDTFDDEALRTLRLRYPKDPLYPRIEGYRILQKALGTYIEKLKASPLVGADNRLRDRYRHTPKTLRLAMELLQVLPRPLRGTLPEDDPRQVYGAIRKCFIPTPGHEFVAADFAGIEPLMVAYLARDAAYLRACRLGSHSWFTANVIGRPVDILTASDADVHAHFEELAAGGPYKVNGQLLPWKQVRDGCKTAHMASLYLGGPGEIARANPELFPQRKDAAYYQDAFFALVPSVPRWHLDTAEQAERVGYLTTPTGFRLHYFNLFDYRWHKKTGRWVKKLSRTAKEAIAAVPQHLGMMYLATAATTFAEERPDLADWVRLLIHDEIFGEPPAAVADEWAAVLTEVMQRPHPLMPLWPEAQAAMGGETHLRVAAEVKRSRVSWGEMR